MKPKNWRRCCVRAAIFEHQQEAMMALDITELKSLFEEDNKKITALRSEIDGLKGNDVVTEEKLNRMKADLAETIAAKAAIELKAKAVEDRLAELETKAGRPGAFDGKGSKQADEHKAAFLEFARKGAAGGAMDRLYQVEQKAADVRTSTGASGGFALPKEIADQVYKVLMDTSPIRSIARVVTTGTTDYHQVVNRGGLAAEWVGETSTRTQPTATPDFADVAPTFGELSAPPEATRHSLNDLFFDVEAMLVADGTERFGIAEGIAFISGDGVNKPTGFLTGTPVVTGDASRAFGVLQYRATGQAAALATNAFDTFKRMLFDLKAGYRGNATYVMNSLTMAELAVIKDTTGQYLLEQAVRAGEPDTISSRPVLVAEDMPNIAANTFPVALGDFQRGYLIADIPGVWMVRDEITKVGWVRFPMAKRVGGRMLDSNAIKLLKIAAS
jgi:HK97 family phage major capsid protein